MKRFMLFFACLLFVAGSALAQSRKVTGTVTDAKTGEALVGAQVFVPGTSFGTTTNSKGHFTLANLPSKYKTLTVSYFGMETKLVPVAAVINVQLAENSKVLDEAIVVAYGVEKKSSFTGSAAEVKTEDITAHVTSNAVNALVGKVAGVQTTSTSGEPGSAPAGVRIRGIGSLNASSSPLYIVDGAPTELSITNINPQDIESMTVLKDAAASAIYGARGANGVIIITTKRAKKDQPATVTFDAKWGSNSRLVPQYDVIDNAAGYYETQYRALYNSKYYNGSSSSDAYAFADAAILDRNNGGLGYQVYTVPNGEKFIGTNFKLNPNATLGYVKDGYYYTPDNWYDEAFSNSFRQEYNASISGSSEKLNYYASLGYLDDGGFVSNSGYKRYTGRTNIEYEYNKYIKLTTNMSYTQGISQTANYDATTYGSSGNIFYLANMIAPIYPLYVRNADGSIMMENGRVVYDANQTAQSRPAFVGNAIRDNEFNKARRISDVFHGQWGAVVTPLEGLTLNANFTADIYNSRYNKLYSPYGSSSGTDGAAYVSHSRTQSVNQQYFANYSHTFANVHNMTLLAGYEQYNLNEYSLSASNTHLFDPNIGELNNTNSTKNRELGSSRDQLMREGFFGRVQYDYDSKYFASASIRRDASSKFAPGHRWGTFGSFGAAWQMNKEDFLKDVTWIDLLKLKASWGSQGNDGGMDYHIWADRYTTSYDEETKSYSITQVQKGNTDITWEKNKEWNFGVEFELFKGRLNGSVEWYTRKTTDLLYTKSFPLSSGQTAQGYNVNVGSMLNNGLEIALEGVVLKTNQFEWALNFNATTNHNEILELDPDVAEGGIKSSSSILREGGSRYQAYMIKYAGVDKTNGKAMYYKDVTDNQGNVIGRTTTYDYTAATKYDCGSTLPSWYGGFGTTFKGYGFDLTVGFSWQLGGKIYDGGYQQLMHNGLSQGSNMHKDLLNAWSYENPNSNIPRLSAASADDGLLTQSQTPIDFFLTSSNYLCLNNLTLGYTLPKSIVQPLKLNNVRVYFSGENLFLLTKRKGLDPRYNFGIGSMTQGAGLASGDYASSRSIAAGISITF